MVATAFRNIALIGKPKHQGTNQTLAALLEVLANYPVEIQVDERVAADLNIPPQQQKTLEQLGEWADLAIVIGGDGNMLSAARVLSRHDLCLLGVNRGNLGFLTDLAPDDLATPIGEILAGAYQREDRVLLNAQIYRDKQLITEHLAVNEVVLHAAQVAHMISFEVYVDQQLMLGIRADGLIAATPTGSTAYSLSAGGPIISPDLDVFTLVPMFPHTLSSRPIVVGADKPIHIDIAPDNSAELFVTCDSHVSLSIHPGDQLVLQPSSHKLKLIHPNNYSYFSTLRGKLHWGGKLF